VLEFHFFPMFFFEEQSLFSSYVVVQLNPEINSAQYHLIILGGIIFQTILLVFFFGIGYKYRSHYTVEYFFYIAIIILIIDHIFYPLYDLSKYFQFFVTNIYGDWSLLFAISPVNILYALLFAGIWGCLLFGFIHSHRIISRFEVLPPEEEHPISVPIVQQGKDGFFYIKK